MICFPNAKINLGLNVTGKRPDGYHEIETVFYPVPLKDALEIVPSDRFSFDGTGIPIDAPAERNLVVKALRLVESLYRLPPVGVYLRKAIPSGAGLGGGSSDAAFMLKLLNGFHRLGIAEGTLEGLAERLGADCPFFIRNKPVFASGKGNVFEPVSLSLKGYYLCLVKPGIAVSTAEAYAAVTPQKPAISLKEAVALSPEAWRGVMVNDFERSLFPKYPVIGEIKRALYDAGAVYASMSGSGSSVYGLFRQPVNVKTRFPSCFVWEGELE
jgi:4-diphosphocytidyl-2-C-methyl-D-erythritol kinase